uniref:Gastrula zinc finger protein XlCGF57.1-like n=1 Tax=Poecilia reticulata TaxID=8081 RepID=A0A3P9NI89_POERE
MFDPFWENRCPNLSQGEPLSVKEEADASRSPVIAVLIKSEDDEDEPLISDLRQTEDGELPSSSSAQQNLKAEPEGEEDDEEQPDSGSETEDSDDEWKESRTPDSASEVQPPLKKDYLNKHRKCHTGEKPYGCDVCEQRFRVKSKLNRHMKIHTGEKPFSCEVCEQKFRVKSSLNRHIRVHTGDKPFSCDFCGRNFRNKSTLNNHIRIHAGEKAFICDVWNNKCLFCRSRMGFSGCSLRNMATQPSRCL